MKACNQGIFTLNNYKSVVSVKKHTFCFQFQGYGNVNLPKNVANGQLYKQAGNSVTVPLIRLIAKNIKSSI